MSGITKLEVSELAVRGRVSGSIGKGADSALSNYNEGLNQIVKSGFGTNDTSSVHEVIGELISSSNTILQAMDEVDFMLDCLLDMIWTDIIEKEDAMAAMQDQ